MEKQLSVKDRQDPGEKASLRSALKGRYLMLIKGEPLYSSQNDIDNRLWRVVFYSQLEELKKQCKREGQKDALFAFIEEVKIFYEELLDALLEQKDDTSWEYSVDDRGKPVSVNTALIRLLSSCQNHLGDLSRYREVYDSDECKDWEIAIEWYTAAHRSNPFSGNPHNQLAVLAHYSEDYLEAVYRYYRSLAAREPFLATRENLINFFEKIRRNSVLRTQSCRYDPSQRAWHVSPHSSYSISAFTTAFLSVHGMLFTRTNLECFDITLDYVAAMLNTLLSRPEATEELLMRLMAMNIFTVHNASYRPEGYRPTAADDQQRQVLKAKALELAFTFFACIADMDVTAGHASLCVFINWITNDDEILPALLAAVPEAELFSRLSRLVSTLSHFAGTAQPTEEMLVEEMYLHGFVCLNQWGIIDAKVGQRCCSMSGGSAKRLQRLQPFIRHAKMHGFLVDDGSTLVSTKEVQQVPSFSITEQHAKGKGTKGGKGVVGPRKGGNNRAQGGKSGKGKGKGSVGQPGDVGINRKGDRQKQKPQEPVCDEESDEETVLLQPGQYGMEKEAPAVATLEQGINNLLMHSKQQQPSMTSQSQAQVQGIDLSSVLKTMDTGASQITLSQAKDMLPMDLMLSQTQHTQHDEGMWGIPPTQQFQMQHHQHQHQVQFAPSASLYSSLKGADQQDFQLQQPAWQTANAAPWSNTAGYYHT
eukprot:TRINITY_DN5014_c6_g1_i1.p1 TRINITY_DN5014_c6_g1~~TRINITY_DN5014_c6_g1_i1.p1  ORF type:complete len:761 (+),score=223.57 TRINITY_DN5014_c6_g1_i1:174-2285(+)